MVENISSVLVIDGSPNHTEFIGGRETDRNTDKPKGGITRVTGDRKSCNFSTLVASNYFPTKMPLQLVEVGMSTKIFSRIDGNSACQSNGCWIIRGAAEDRLC